MKASESELPSSNKADKRTTSGECIPNQKIQLSSKDTVQLRLHSPPKEQTGLYEEVNRVTSIQPKQQGTSAVGQGSIWYEKTYGIPPPSQKVVEHAGAPQGSFFYPTIKFPSSNALTRSLTESPTVLATPIKPAATLEAKEGPDDILHKARRKSNTLLIVVIGVVITTAFLLLGLGLVIYFTAVGSSGTDKGIITAHGLCQHRYGKCAGFAGKHGSPYPENCSQNIPCFYHCYYPTVTLDEIDHNYVKSSNGKYASIGNGLQKGFYVSGRNGLICGERSTCQDGNCKVTASYAYDVKIDPNSASECINSTYRANVTVCIDTDRCHQNGDYCQVAGQIRMGFRILPTSRGYHLHTLGCGRSCGRQGSLLSTSDWLRKRNCAYLNALNPGGCMYSCSNTTRTIPLPAGTPCNSTREGYCWRGRCFERERFPQNATHTTLEPLSESCYSNNNGVRCYIRSKSVDCNDVHMKDKYGKAITRYGGNCISWDTSGKVPKKYRKYGSTGCILNDKNMPWCYSGNKNVIWNYCYDFCPSISIDEKNATSVRIMTFSYSQNARHSLAEQAAKHFKKVKADIVAILSWPDNPYDRSDKLMKKLIKLLNDKVSDSQKWKLCSDKTQQRRTRILLRGPLNGTTKPLPGTSDTAGCVVSNSDGQTFVIVATTAPYMSYPAVLPSSSCICSSGVYICKRKSQIPGYETTRHEMIIKLLDVVRDIRTNLLVVGNFGQPSHLDWTQNASHLHCNDTYSWGISMSMSKAGFHDSYRVIHKDPSMWPGATWSTLSSHKDTLQARYAYQYYKGPSITPVRAETYPAGQPSKALEKEWPSNRYAVVVDYQL